jgi:hypothetical protein
MGGVSSATAADPLDTWYWRNPSPQGNPLHGVCFGEEEFVAVGSNGTVMTSPDGEAWLNQESGTRISLHGVTHAAGRFVAVGELGLILYSDDARFWQRAASPWFYHLYAVTWGDGLFVAVGEDSAILTSPDGVTWTLQRTGSLALSSVSFGNGAFVAGGGTIPEFAANPPPGASMQILLQSTDGLEWTAVSLGLDGAVTALGYGLGKHILALGRRSESYLLSSVDGRRWTLDASFSSFGFEVSAIATDGSRMRAVFASRPWNFHYSLVSDDGATWAFDQSARLASRNGLTVGAGRFVAVGSVLDYNDYGLDGIVVKRGLSDWQSVGIEQKSPARLVTGKGMVVGLRTDWDSMGAIVGTSAVTTTNGAAWERHPVILGGYLPDRFLTFGNGRFIGWNEAGLLAHSADARNWTVTTNAFGAGSTLTSLLPGNGVYLWLPRGELAYRSTDLTNWETVALPASIPAYPIRRPALYGNGWFVVRDDAQGGVHRSNDGLSWEFHALPELPDLLGFHQDRFLGWRNGLVSSPNGIDWQRVGNAPDVGPFLDAAYADGVYLVFGVGWTQNSPGLLIASRDEGATWTTHQLTGDQPFWSASLVYNSVLLSGSHGALIQSAPLTNAAPNVLRQLSSVASQPGEPLGLQGETFGTPPLTHEWYRDGLLVTGAVEPLLAVRNLAEGAAHDYVLVTSNAHGAVTNGPARIVVGRPATLGVAVGTSVNGSLTGTAGLTYRVDYRDGSPAEGTWQTLTNLTLAGPNGVFTDAPPTNRFYRAELVP